jgi:transglutaminase-like putative cysteine protease
MNRFQITHTTLYTYSAPVQLGIHSLRLRPREGHDLRIEASSLTIQPQATLRWHRDVENNSVATATFSEAASQLLIKSNLDIQQYDQNPFAFLVEDYALVYPFSYALEDLPLLNAYRHCGRDSPDPLLTQWLEGIWRPGATVESVLLLQRLNQAIHSFALYQQREEPGVQSAAETLTRASGSCRDLAFLFMEAAKVLGFAARFVSGYCFNSSPDESGGSTHAWAEAFIPGAGWKGFDPTGGVMVGDNHIPLAVGRTPQSVPPVAGSFSGQAQLLAMEVDVAVDVAVDVVVGKEALLDQG